MYKHIVIDGHREETKFVSDEEYIAFLIDCIKSMNGDFGEKTKAHVNRLSGTGSYIITKRKGLTLEHTFLPFSETDAMQMHDELSDYMKACLTNGI